MKTLQELRSDFEKMAVYCMFDITRNKNGEYVDTPRSTYMLWAGYWECAKTNGIIEPHSDWIDSNR